MNTNSPLRRPIVLLAQLTVCLTALAALGCAPSGPADNFIDAMKNADYKDSLSHSGTIHLTDGVYREPTDSPYTNELLVRLGDVAVGDLIGDGSIDGAGVLITDPGGSSTFYQLVAVVNKNGTPVHVASTLLGDRVLIQSVSIHDTQIQVQMLTQGPDDPMSHPTYQVTQVYRLEGAGLVRMK